MRVGTRMGFKENMRTLRCKSTKKELNAIEFGNSWCEHDLLCLRHSAICHHVDYVSFVSYREKFSGQFSPLQQSSHVHGFDHLNSAQLHLIRDVANARTR